MYQYDHIDQTLVNERVEQYRDQLSRRLSDEMSEDEFRPLRLQNGLYMQRHAYMLRVAIPYGMLSSRQLRTLADIAKHHDKDYGHFTTRQNIQYNWITLEETPDILARLAQVEMHAIQTSGNCIRNITSDPFAGVAKDEIVDPRPMCELLRQWSTLHPEFAYLPRKFKIAISGSAEDRAVVMAHDIGLYLRLDENKALIVDVVVGGGLGRTPILGEVIRKSLPWQETPAYLSAILRVYNLYGRRDNMYKARIKILVKALGADNFAKEVETEYQESINDAKHLPHVHPLVSDKEWQRIAQHFTRPAYLSQPNLSHHDIVQFAKVEEQKDFARFLFRNTKDHQVDGYRIVIVSLKPHGDCAPGDATSTQMYAIAELADQYSFGEIRVTHEQNLVLSDVEQTKIYALWQKLTALNLANPNIGYLTDIIACPGGDFCSLANARSLPIAKAIQQTFDNLDYLHDIGDISLNISGCINSCGHHHVGNIGILGVDKDGQECYQITLGGAQGNATALGKVIGPAFSAEAVPPTIQTIINTYLRLRETNEHTHEPFIDTVNRVGINPFKEQIYGH